MKLFTALPKIVLMGILLIAPMNLDAQSAIVGYNKRTILNGSDTIVSIPFEQFPKFFTTVSSDSSEANGTVTFGVDAPAALTQNELSGGFYLKVVSGSAEGRKFPIIGNSASSISIDASGEVQLNAGTKIQVIPQWTLSNLFADHRSAAIHDSGGKLPVQRGTEILFFDTTRAGIELAPDQIFFRTVQGWFQATAGYPSADDVVIPPGSAFVIRHPSGVSDTTLIVDSYVDTGNSTATLKTSGGNRQDVALGLPRPIPVKLDDLNLTGAATFVSSATTAAADRADELLVFDNSAAIINKKPSKTYFKIAEQWHLDDENAYPVAGDDEVAAGAGIIIRKSPTAAGDPHIWVNTPTY